MKGYVRYSHGKLDGHALKFYTGEHNTVALMEKNFKILEKRHVLQHGRMPTKGQHDHESKKRPAYQW